MSKADTSHTSRQDARWSSRLNSYALERCIGAFSATADIQCHTRTRTTDLASGRCPITRAVNRAEGAPRTPEAGASFM